MYDDLQDIVTDILSDQDIDQKTIYYVKVTTGTGPADNPGVSTLTSIKLNGVAKGINWKYSKQGFVTETDLEVVVSVNDNISPAKGDFIDIDSVRYKIISDVSVPSANTRVVWKFIVRKVG